MPAPITANYFDGRLNDIRATLHGMTDEAPFLLMPLKIETRFMKVERPDHELGLGQLELILGKLGIIAAELAEGIPPTFNNYGLQNKYNTIRDNITEVTAQMIKLPPITRKQKGWVVELGQTVSAEGAAIITGLQNKSGLESTANGLAAGIEELESKIAEIEVKKDVTFGAAADLIDQLRKTYNRLNNINSGNIPYTSFKNKRRLYGFVEKLYTDIGHLYRMQPDKFETIKAMQLGQLERIQELHRNIKEEVKQLPNNLVNVHRDDNWKGFVQKMAEDAETKLPPLFGRFENQDVKRFEFATTIKKTGADELFYKSVQALIEIKRFNKAGEDRYHHLKTSRNKIKSKIINLQKTANQPIEGHPEQISAFQDLWQNINEAFEAYKNKTNQTITLNPSQQYGVEQSKKYIGDQAQPALNPINEKAINQHKFVNNQQINNSWSFISKSIEILEEFDQNPNPFTGNDTDVWHSKLRELSKQFEIAARDHTVLNEQEAQQLEALIIRLENKKGNLPPEERERFEAEMVRIKELLGMYYIWDKENLWNIGKGDPVFVTPTSTVNELWVRIFPDDIFIDTHEEELTADEKKDGKDFWLSYWAAGPDYDLQLGAWRYLHESYGPQRAAWISQQMDPRPSNPDQFDANGHGRTPSSNLIYASQRLEDININLKKSLEHEREPYAIINILNRLVGKRVMPDLSKVISKIRSIRYDQAYFLQKMWDQYRITAAYLDQINNLVSGIYLPNNLHDYWSRTLIYFSQLSKELKEIQPLTSVQVIERYRNRLNFNQVEQTLGESKPEQWTKAPQAKGLPHRFVVLTMNEDKFSHIVVSNPVDQNLKLGLSPQNLEQGTGQTNQDFQLDEEGNLQVSEDIKWMVEYGEAIRKGMAVSIPLTPEEAETGFDKLLVLGVREDQNGGAILKDLFQNHQYSHDGISFLQIGAPTNNTKEQPSDFRNLESDPELSFKLALGLPLYTYTTVSNNADFAVKESALLNKSDGQRLAEALGLSPGFFQHIQGSDRTQIGNALAINKAMWHATFGFYMEEMWDMVFTYDNIDRTRHFFNHYCLGRGMLPSLRIGTQPYGILPTTAFSRMKFRRGNSGDETIDHHNLPDVTRDQMNEPMTHSLNKKLQVRYDARLAYFLMNLNEEWTSLRENGKVKHVHNVRDVDNPQQHFMNMLGLHATSVEHYYRFGINIASRTWQDQSNSTSLLFNFEHSDIYGPVNLSREFGQHIFDGRYYKALDFVDETTNLWDPGAAKIARIYRQFEEAGLFKWRFFDQNARFSTNMISDKALSEEGLENLSESNQNYIEWLLDNNLFHILGATKPDQVLSNKVLFLMLRQSLLMAYRNAAMGILQLEGFFREPYRKFIGSANHYKIFEGQTNDFNYATKWTYLFRELRNLDQLDFQNYSATNFYQYFDTQTALHKAMAEYLYPLEGNPLIQYFPNRDSHEPFFNQITEVRTAFNKLANLSTQELDRLLHEHLDLNSYRLDAWILGLANRKLTQQRKTNTNSIYLGAYGWLEDLRRDDTRDLAESIPEGLYRHGEGDIYTVDKNRFIHAPSLDHALSAAILRSGYLSNSATNDTGNQMAVNLSSRRVRMALNLVQGVQNGLDVGAILGFQMERGLHEMYTNDSDLELDRYILPLRMAYPLQIQIEDTAVNTDEKPHTNVINGKSILDEIQDIITNHSIPIHLGTYQIITQSDFLRCPTKVVKAVTGHNTIAALRAAGSSTNVQNRLIRHLRAICKEIDRMADAFDALGDLAISESVYQVVKGNYARVGSLLQALAEGKTPSDFQITNTPRTGTVINQRVILNIDRTLYAKPTHWNANLTPRAKAEPSINKWLGEILGNPSDIRCLATYKIGEIEVPVTVSLKNLAIHPLDVLHMLGENPERGGSELSRRVAYYIRASNNLTADVEIQLRFTERNPQWDNEANDIRSFYEIEPLLKQIRSLLANSRAVSAEDLKNPEANPDTDNPGNQNLGDLRNRVISALQTLRDPNNSINSWFGSIDTQNPAFTDAQLSAIEDFLHIAGNYGVATGIPDNMQGLANNAMQTLRDHTQNIIQLAQNKVNDPGPPAGLPRPVKVLEEGIQALESTEWWQGIDPGDPAYSDNQIATIAQFMELAQEFGIAGAGMPNNGYIKGMIKAIHAQTKGALAKTQERLKPVGPQETKANDTSLPVIRRIEALVEISRQLFGKSFLVLPSYRPGNLKTMIKDQHDLPAGQQLLRHAMDPVSLVMEDWLNCLADVRPKMYALQMSGALNEAFGQDPWEIKPAQTPYQEGDYWVGRSYPAEFGLDQDKLSLVLINPEKLTSGSTTSYEVGIVLDEWVEIIPNEQETTGITFSYNQPDAKPPQNLLLAVTPAQTEHWNWDDLVYTLLESLELAKNRAVEPDHLEHTKLAQALPTIVAEAALSQNLSEVFSAFQVLSNYQTTLFSDE